MLLCLLWHLLVHCPPLSAPVSWDGASSGPPIQASLGLADGRGGPTLSKVTLPAIRDQPIEHAGLNLFKVVCLRTDFSLQEADVRLIASLLLKHRTGGREAEQLKMSV